MNEPTSTLTFRDLVVRTAEYMGVADYDDAGVVAIPADAHDLEKVKRIVNDGIRMFITDAKPTGWYWRKRFLSVTFNAAGTGPFNIEGDAARYKLTTPYFNGVVDGRITYKVESDHGVSLGWTSEADLRRMREINDYAGYPQFAAVRPYKDGIYELLLYPTPHTAETVEFPYVISFDLLDDLDQSQPAGTEFDDAVLAACKAKAEMENEDLANGPWVAYYQQKALPNAHKADDRLRPRKLGYNSNMQARLGRGGRKRYWNTVEY